MAAFKMPDGQFKDIAHPISSEFRKVLEDKILGAYHEEVRRAGSTPSQATPPPEAPPPGDAPSS